MKTPAVQGGRSMDNSNHIVGTAPSQPVLDKDSVQPWTGVPAEDANQSQTTAPKPALERSDETAEGSITLSPEQVRESNNGLESFQAKRWRKIPFGALARLREMDLPLLAAGADKPGEKGRKAPCRLKDGALLSGWTTAKHSISDIESACARVIACGTRTGKDAHGLLVFDIDGATARAWLQERGCDQATTPTWQIHRNTDPMRLKVAFRLNAEQQQQLGQLHKKEDTKPPVKDADGKVIAKGEAVELFHGVGQVIVLGQHWESKGIYFWPEGMGPEDLAPIPAAWWQAALEITGKPAATRTVSSTGKGEWRSLPECPICGRNSTGYCSQHRDGKTIRCFHGSTFSPELAHEVLQPGDEITDKQGTVWAFSKAEPQANGDVFSVFVTPDPTRRKTGIGAAPARVRGVQAITTDPRSAEVARRYFRELLADALAAIRRRDEDTEMEIRAEIMGRFKRSDAQITAALFRLLTEQETGRPAGEMPRLDSLDLEQIEGMDPLVDGFMPENDLGLMYGAKGSGKTAAALAMSFAVIDGAGFLDHSKPAEQGAVLFIASDSGAAPLMAEMQRMGLADHPATAKGPGRRFYLWAYSAAQGMTAWSASINGCVDLLQFVKDKGVRLVVMDSAKTICAKAGILYLDNDSVTALLTFMKETICAHAAVLILSHDGTEKGCHSGAKAWAEVPSIVHHIQQIPDRNQERLWRVVKNRMGQLRELRYQLGEDGRLEPVAGVEMIRDASAAVLQVLRDAHGRGVGSVSNKDLVAEIGRRFQLAPKTVANTLTRMVGASKPEICRVSSKRGHYKLAPRLMVDPLNSVQFFGKEEGQTPVVEGDLTSSRPLPEGRTWEEDPVIPDSSQLPTPGKKPNSNPRKGSELFGSLGIEMPLDEVELVELPAPPAAGSSWDLDAA